MQSIPNSGSSLLPASNQQVHNLLSSITTGFPIPLTD